MIENRSAPPGAVVPRLIYHDVSKAIEWLRGAFGFTERLRTPAEPDGTIHHAQLAIGEGSAILTGGTATNEFGPSISVPVADVDAHFERAKAFGARIIRPPATHPFGERQYSVADPEGHEWTFSQSVADVKPEEWGAKVSEIKSRLELLPLPRLCYVEIPAVDVHQAAAFYQTVFGWNIRHRDTARPSFDDAAGFISGAWVTGRKISREPGLLPYIWVSSIDDILDKAAANGGEMVEGPHLDSPGGQWIATFRDPAGNLIGLYCSGTR